LSVPAADRLKAITRIALGVALIALALVHALSFGIAGPASVAIDLGILALGISHLQGRGR